MNLWKAGLLAYLLLILFAAVVGIVGGKVWGAERFHSAMVGFVSNHQCTNMIVEGVELKGMKAGTAVIVHLSCLAGDPV